MPLRARVRRTIAKLRWVAFALLMLACSKRGSPKADRAQNGGFETLELRYQGSPGNVSFPELAEDLGYLAPLKLEFIGSTISGPQDIQTVVTGDADFGGAFNGAILKLIAAKAAVRPIIGYYGVDDQTYFGFYLLENSPIRRARDLIGKRVAINTLGAHGEFVLREYLSRNGLSPAEIEQVTLVVLPPVSSEQALREHEIDVAALSGILRDKALERGGIRKLFSDYELFGKFTAGSYVMTTQFLRDNPHTARHFVEATARAIEWARATPREEVIAHFTSIIAHRGRNEDASAIKYWRSTGISKPGGLLDAHEYQIWIDWLVKDHQLSPGQIRIEDVLNNDLNPFQNNPT